MPNPLRRLRRTTRLRLPFPPARAALALPVLLLVALLAAPAAAVDADDTLLLSTPALSADHLAFGYEGDLWIAGTDGESPRRLTTHEGRELQPHFSADGRWIAFTGQYDGNWDAYVMAVEGGAPPRRLTWHPGADFVHGFTPEGDVLFASQRGVHTGRYTKLYAVSVDGGFPRELPLANAFAAAFSPDGTRVAYNPLPPAFQQWKNYRGGTTSRIWIYTLADRSVVEIPRPEAGANDADPLWHGDTVLFRSDRDGEFNLYRFDPAAGTVEALTDHGDHPVLTATVHGDTVVYNQAGRLHRLDLASGTAAPLPVGVSSDLVERRPRWASGPRWVRGADLSPSAARVALEYRGEIVTVPAEDGSPRNLTASTGANDRHPRWSPDGRRMAWFSDASGEYRLHVGPSDGRGEVVTYDPGGAGYYEDPKWSPDGTKISYTDNSWSLYWMDLSGGDADGAVTKVSQEPVYGPIKTLHHAWSPDSAWLAYTRVTDTYHQRLHLHEVESGEDTAITDGLADVGEPVFDASGKYLWFTASTDAGPVRAWFAQSNADMEATEALYLAVLAAGEPSPLAAESDEEFDSSSDDGSNGEEGENGDGEGDDGEGGTSDGSDGAPSVTIDLDGLAQRIVTVPTPAGGYSSLQPGADGQLYYMRGRVAVPFSGEPSGLYRYDLASREETELVGATGGFDLSADASKILWSGPGGAWFISPTGGPLDPSSGKIAIDDVRVRVDPAAEWPQIFHEAWRINRDYFYDPGMHGADWDAVRAKYEVFLPHLTNRRDLFEVIRWMGSELAVGHHYQGDGDYRLEPEEISVGLLGADYEIVDGRYRFARIFGGLNWNPDLRAPLTEPGVEAKVGEFLLAVDGREVRAPDNLYSFFEGKAGEVVELTIGPGADGENARRVRVVPVESESSLRNRAWVEGNLQKVTEATDGRVAYVYVPNTAGAGHTYFKRYFFPQADREAVIVDERYNGGGQIADYYIDILRRPFIAYWNTRYGDDLKSPLISIQGPKAMLIDETAGSGGDLLPWMFRELDMGPLIGKRTWGGLVGILGFPMLMDGGGVTAPNLAFWTPEDGWAVENEGVAPDMEVEQWPADILDGRDPQLERAIQWILEQLPAEPPAAPQPPPYPDRSPM